MGHGRQRASRRGGAVEVTVERTVTKVPVTTLANGHVLELTLHELHGREAGPTLGVVAGIHGDEPLGPETVRRLLEQISSEPLRGTVLALPVANAYAFQALTRNTPLDMSNLNRIFPGDPNGMLSEQLAHAICSQLLDRCDAIIDFHSGGNLATVDYAYIHEDDIGLAHAFSCEILYRAPYFEGTFTAVARERGIHSVVSELGGGQQLNVHYLEKGVRGAVSVMKALGMLPGEPTPPKEQTIVEELATLRPHQGGVMLSTVDPSHLGETVPRGTELARIVSPHTFEALEVITAPFDPSIMILTRQAVTTVNPGDYGIMVANGATAKVVDPKERLEGFALTPKDRVPV